VKLAVHFAWTWADERGLKPGTREMLPEEKFDNDNRVINIKKYKKFMKAIR
jgi:hypothetical protein